MASPGPIFASGGVLVRRPDALPPGPDRTFRLIWTAMGFFLAAIVLGFGWDRSWHASHPFENFWSPPHLFIYASFALAGLTAVRMALTASVREHLDRGAVFLAVAGFAVIGAAGLFDSAWHTAFGLDETGWSFPHALLGWGTLMTFLGLLSCRLALRRRRPLGGVERAALGTLGFLFALGVLQGPLGGNVTAERLRHIAALPVLAAEAPAQHTFRIYLAWNLTHAGPLFVPVSAFAVGAGLMLFRVLVRGRAAFLTIIAAWTLLSLLSGHATAKYLGIAGDPRNWLPLPVLPSALTVLACLKTRLGERRAWIAAGVVYGACTVWFWGSFPLLALLGGPGMLAGALAAQWAYRVVDAPTERVVIRLVAVSVAAPALLGVVDLFLRSHTA
jgi:hypothetical protein